MAALILGASVADVPRFEGDPILCGVCWPVLRDGVVVARIYEHPTRYRGGFAFVSMTKIAWAGPRPAVLEEGDHLFYDFVSRSTTAAETLPEVVERVARIDEWRAKEAG